MIIFVIRIIKRNDGTSFESNFGSSYTYEYYDNESDLWVKNKIQNPASYAYDGNSGDSTIYVKVSQGGFCRFLYHRCYFEDNAND